MVIADVGTYLRIGAVSINKKKIKLIRSQGNNVLVDVSSREKEFHAGNVIAIDYREVTDPQVFGSVGELEAFVLSSSQLNQLTLVERNIDIVESGGALSVQSQSNGVAFAAPTRVMLTLNNVMLIRQTGILSSISFYYLAGTLPTQFYIEIWRKDGNTWDRISKSGNLFSQIVAGQVNTIAIETPVMAGDYMAFEGLGGGNSFGYVSGYAAGSFRYQSGAVVTEFDYDWTTATTIAVAMPIKYYQRAPLLVGIGDSIMAGHPGNYSGLESSFVNLQSNSITGQLEIIDPLLIAQNCGIGSQATTAIAARFATHVTALKPKIALINGGVNDIAGGITKAVFMANYTAMLNACVAASIIPVVCKITPWTAGTNLQMQTRDDWMTSLQALVATYTGAVWVDFDSAIGQFRAGGDAGNLWNLQTAFNADGIHLTLSGYAAMAAVIDTAIKAKYRFT